MKTTEIEKVRRMAAEFARLPIKPVEGLPFLVSHPFADSTVIALPGKDGPELVDISERAGEERFKESLLREFEGIDNVAGFFLKLSKAYRFAFLSAIESFLSDDDLAGILRFVWTNSEYTNSDSVFSIFSKQQLVSLFRRSSQEKLMDEEELAVFGKLPERITVYRGVTSVNVGDLKVLSWTLSRSRAEWFATRFSDELQEVYQAELPRAGALAYFSSEEEIIANPSMLENIHKIQRIGA